MVYSQNGSPLAAPRRAYLTGNAEHTRRCFRFLDVNFASSATREGGGGRGGLRRSGRGGRRQAVQEQRSHRGQ